MDQDDPVRAIKSCTHIKGKQLDQTVVTEEMIEKELAASHRALPTYELSAFDLACVRHYSLQRHHRLRCRWRQYKHQERTQYKPFFFPDHRDLHFHNGLVRFNPALSKFRQTDHRMKMKLGPGVDRLGQMPIAAESLKRGEPKHEKNKNTHRLKKRKNVRF